MKPKLLFQGAVMTVIIMMTSMWSVVATATESIYLTVAYCPDEFSGAGAIVKVDPTSGSWSIAGRFKWPDEIFGCPLEYDPTITFDTLHGHVYLDFTDDFGYLIVIDVARPHITWTVKPDDPFFVGFINMAYNNITNSLLGLQPHVTQSGFCDNGCFQLGSLGVTTGHYSGMKDVPYKAMMDDSHYVDVSKHKFWVQGSYPLSPEARCSSHDSDLCLISLDKSGTLLSTKYTNWTIYKYGQQQGSDGSMLAWVEGFDSKCQHPYNNFAFANVSLDNASAQLIACMDHNVTLHMDEWVASFNNDDTLLATGSGNAETPDPQLLVLNTQSGKAVVNTKLDGLAAALKAEFKIVEICIIVAAAAPENIYLTVAYCQGPSRGGGALVRVDPITGNWRVAGQWPLEPGSPCALDIHPASAFDLQNGFVYLDFVQFYNYYSVIDVTHASRAPATLEPQFHLAPFDIMVHNNQSNQLVGIGTTFQPQSFDIATQYGTAGDKLPYNLLFGASRRYDGPSSTIWIQASRPLTPAAKCSSRDNDTCLVTLNAISGQVISTQYTNWTVMQYSNVLNSDGSMLTWVKGSEFSQCNNGNALINLLIQPTIRTQFVACLDPAAPLGNADWHSSFNRDGSLLTLSQHDQQKVDPVFIVFDTRTGKALVNGHLVGLAQQLFAQYRWVEVWSADFYTPPTIVH